MAKINVSPAKMFGFLQNLLKPGNFLKVELGIYNGNFSSLKVEESIDLQLLKEENEEMNE